MSDIKPAGSNEILSKRIFDFPRETVFSAFSNPDVLKLWWGPKGFSNIFQDFDFQKGGYWRFNMVGPDGTKYPNKSKFLEIKKPESIVLQHDTAPQFILTITLIPHGTKTELVWRMRMDSHEEYNAVKKFVAVANEQNFDRLQVQLTKLG